MMKRFSVLILISLLVSVCFEAQAQCKEYTKKHCFSLLEDYINTGAYNGAIMHEGEEAELTQTFYEGQEYRLLVCANDSISEILFFEVLNADGDILYSSEETKSNKFDFGVETTQALKVRIVAPNVGTDLKKKKSGCISILVGFKGTVNENTKISSNQ